MVQAHGVLEGPTRVVVHDQAEASRLADRGSYGLRDKGALVLDLLEAGFLVEEERLHVVDPAGSTVDHRQLLTRGATTLDGFETAYLAYRDHRARGFVVRARDDGLLDVWTRGAAPPRQAASMLAAPRGEAEHAGPRALFDLIDQATRLDRSLLVAVVDEESDVTYYELGPAAISGSVPDPVAALAAEAGARLLRDRALVTLDPGLEAAGYGNRAGGELFLSLPEAHHLAALGLALVDEAGDAVEPKEVQARAERLHPDAAQALGAYSWLRGLSLVPKTGFKFGVQYRVYKGLPGEGHAPFLVHAIDPEAAWTFRGLARYVRLAHSVKKRAVLWSEGRGVMVQWVRP